MKFYFRTLGCKMNWLDSACLGAALQSGGHHPAASEAEADTVFVNSCTVTNRADRQSRQEAFRAGRANKQVIVFGCGPKTDQAKWASRLPNAKVFAGPADILDYFGISESELEFPLQERVRIPVAIQTGCDNHCTFCITRIARGKTEDFSKDGILRQIHRAEANGVREIVLTGIQLASWGCGDSEKYPQRSKLPGLLNEILNQTGIERIRMSSLGPQFLQDDFFRVLDNERICDHLHLSVQSGSDSVLQKMNRGHGTREVYDIARRARETRPDVALTADFITGFPGETESDFAETMQMVEKIGFAKLHVFPFSPRNGTGAANFPRQIPTSIKKERAKKLREAGSRLRQAFLQSQFGKTKTVIAEDRQTGITTNYIRLKTTGVRPGESQMMRIDQSTLAE